MTRHIAHVPLRWADMDSYGHVNNVVYLRYLQEARVDMLFVHAPKRGVDSFQGGSVVSRHDIGYLAPLRFRARPLQVETWVREVRNSTFTLGYEVVDVDDDARRVYACATTTLVPYDLERGRARRLTAEEKAVLESHVETDGPVPRTRRPSPAGEPGKRHVYQCAVRFDDLDSYGHVNNVIFAEYLQEARIDFAHRHLFSVVDAHQGSVVAGQSIDYLAPVPFRTQPVQVEVWVTHLGESSFEVAYDVRDEERHYARATSTLVTYDVGAQRPRALTAAERAALEPFIGREQ